MYYYEKLKFKIPEEYDGRKIVTGEEKQRILQMYKEGKSFGYIRKATGRVYSTIYRIYDAEKYEVYKRRSRQAAAERRRRRGREEKQQKNRQNRETAKKRIGLLRELLPQCLPKNVRRLPIGRTRKVVNTKKHANL